MHKACSNELSPLFMVLRARASVSFRVGGVNATLRTSVRGSNEACWNH